MNNFDFVMTTENSIMIPMPLVTLNEYINAERRSRYTAARLKKISTATCEDFTRKAMQAGVKFNWPVTLGLDWYMKNKRQDPDNIAFQKKFILDGFQKAGFMANDNWAHLNGFVDRFFIDKELPRVEIRALSEVAP